MIHLALVAGTFLLRTELVSVKSNRKTATFTRVRMHKGKITFKPIDGLRLESIEQIYGIASSRGGFVVSVRTGGGENPNRAYVFLNSNPRKCVKTVYAQGESGIRIGKSSDGTIDLFVPGNSVAVNLKFPGISVEIPRFQRDPYDVVPDYMERYRFLEQVCESQQLEPQISDSSGGMSSDWLWPPGAGHEAEISRDFKYVAVDRNDPKSQKNVVSYLVGPSFSKIYDLPMSSAWEFHFVEDRYLVVLDPESTCIVVNLNSRRIIATFKSDGIG